MMPTCYRCGAAPSSVEVAKYSIDASFGVVLLNQASSMCSMRGSQLITSSIIEESELWCLSANVYLPVEFLGKSNNVKHIDSWIMFVEYVCWTS